MPTPSSITHASPDSLTGWLCVRPSETDDWQHHCAVLDSRSATLTLRTGPPAAASSGVERVVRLGPGAACFPAAELCPGLYTFVLRPDAGATATAQLLLGVPSLEDTRRWLAALQELCLSLKQELRAPSGGGGGGGGGLGGGDDDDHAYGDGDDGGGDGGGGQGFEQQRRSGCAAGHARPNCGRHARRGGRLARGGPGGLRTSRGVRGGMGDTRGGGGEVDAAAAHRRRRAATSVCARASGTRRRRTAAGDMCTRVCTCGNAERSQ